MHELCCKADEDDFLHEYNLCCMPEYPQHPENRYRTRISTPGALDSYAFG